MHINVICKFCLVEIFVFPRLKLLHHVSVLSHIGGIVSENAHIRGILFVFLHDCHIFVKELLIAVHSGLEVCPNFTGIGVGCFCRCGCIGVNFPYLLLDVLAEVGHFVFGSIHVITPKFATHIAPEAIDIRTGIRPLFVSIGTGIGPLLIFIGTRLRPILVFHAVRAVFQCTIVKNVIHIIQQAIVNAVVDIIAGFIIDHIIQFRHIGIHVVSGLPGC